VAEQALGRVRPRGMVRRCVRRLRGGPSAGRGGGGVARGEGSARADGDGWGTEKVRKREMNLGFEMDPKVVVVCTNLKQ